MNDVITKEKLDSLTTQVIWIHYMLIEKHNLLLRKPKCEADCMTESGIDKISYAELIDLTIQRKAELPIIDKALCCCSQLAQLIKDLLSIVEMQGSEKAYDYFLNFVDLPRKQELEKIFKTMSSDEQELINSDLMTYIFED